MSNERLTLEQRAVGERVAKDLVQNLDKVLAMILHKLVGDKPVIITMNDLEKFAKTYGIDRGLEPKLMIHGTEDGLLLRVMTEESANAFTKEHEAAGKGMSFDFKPPKQS